MDPWGREATVMSIENMEIYKLQGGGPTELRPCGSIKRNEFVPIDHDTASQVSSNTSPPQLASTLQRISPLRFRHYSNR